MEELNLGFVSNSFNDSPSGTAKVFFFPGCNLNCGYCYNTSIIKGKIDNSITFEQAKEEIRSIKQVNSKGKVFFTQQWAIFSGGECSLYPDKVMELIELAHQTGIKAGVFTNGLNSDFVARIIKEGKVDYVHMDIKCQLDYYRFNFYKNCNSSALLQLSASICMLIETAKANKDFRADFATVLVQQYTSLYSNAIEGIRNTLYQSGFKPSANLRWSLNAFTDEDGKVEMLDKSFTMETSHISKKDARLLYKQAEFFDPTTKYITLVGYHDDVTMAQKKRAKDLGVDVGSDEYSKLLDLDKDQFEELLDMFESYQQGFNLKNALKTL